MSLTSHPVYDHLFLMRCQHKHAAPFPPTRNDLCAHSNLVESNKNQILDVVHINPAESVHVQTEKSEKQESIESKRKGTEILKDIRISNNLPISQSNQSEPCSVRAAGKIQMNPIQVREAHRVYERTPPAGLTC